MDGTKEIDVLFHIKDIVFVTIYGLWTPLVSDSTTLALGESTRRLLWKINRLAGQSPDNKY